jgi:hypothetical protein
MIRINVVLPPPEGPMMAAKAPFGISKSSFSNIGVSLGP